MLACTVPKQWLNQVQSCFVQASAIRKLFSRIRCVIYLSESLIFEVCVKGKTAGQLLQPQRRGAK